MTPPLTSPSQSGRRLSAKRLTTPHDASGNPQGHARSAARGHDLRDDGALLNQSAKLLLAQQNARTRRPTAGSPRSGLALLRAASA